MQSGIPTKRNAPPPQKAVAQQDIKSMAAMVTVICAVWCQQHDKEALMRGHMANLQAQSVPYEVIYVFDEADTCPAWLAGTKVSVAAPLTIYQAWNVALSLVQTPFVMNLNLDDRLAPNGIEMLQNALEDDDEAVLAAGDWRICFSAAETDDVRHAYDIEEEACPPDWPPAPGVRARFGSGDGRRGAYGPATIWRMAAHVGMPRYPYRFTDGSLIRVIGDAVWWKLLENSRRKLVRLPLIIGHYRSDPSTQAEFRTPAGNEFEKLATLGVSVK